MILDLNIQTDASTVKKQRMVTNLVTSQNFINIIAEKVEKELSESNTGPYVYTHSIDAECTSRSQNHSSTKKGLKRRLFLK